MISLFKELYRHRYALRSLIYVNIKTTVATARLGLLWWVLDPLLSMLVYYFVVKVVFNRGGEDYWLFALCGIVTWQSFSRAVNIATGSLVQNATLIKQVSLPMQLHVMIPALVQAFFFAIGLMIIIVWNYSAVGLHTLAVFFPLLLVVLLSFSLGLFLSILEVYSGDVKKMVSYVLRVGLYASPVLYSPERIYSLNFSENLKMLYAMNPMVHIMPAIRNILMDGHMFQWEPLLWVFGGTLICMQLGLFFFERMAPFVPTRL